MAACSCPGGYTGDPFSYCRRAAQGINTEGFNLQLSKLEAFLNRPTAQIV